MDFVMSLYLNATSVNNQSDIESCNNQIVNT